MLHPIPLTRTVVEVAARSVLVPSAALVFSPIRARLHRSTTAPTHDQTGEEEFRGLRGTLVLGPTAVLLLNRVPRLPVNDRLEQPFPALDHVGRVALSVLPAEFGFDHRNLPLASVRVVPVEPAGPALTESRVTQV